MYIYLQDILKRNTFVYKGRIQLDTSEVTNLPDGKGRLIHFSMHAQQLLSKTNLVAWVQNY